MPILISFTPLVVGLYLSFTAPAASAAPEAPTPPASATTAAPTVAAQHQLTPYEQLRLLKQARDLHPNDAKARNETAKNLAQEYYVSKLQAASTAKAKAENDALQSRIDEAVAEIQAHEKVIEEQNRLADKKRAELMELIRQQDELQAAQEQALSE